LDWWLIWSDLVNDETAFDYLYEDRDYIARHRSRSLGWDHDGHDGFDGDHGCKCDGDRDGFDGDHDHDGFRHRNRNGRRWVNDEWGYGRDGYGRDGCCESPCRAKLSRLRCKVKRHLRNVYSGCQYAYIYTVRRQRLCPGEAILFEQKHEVTEGIQYDNNTGELIFLREGDYKINFSVLTDDNCGTNCKRGEFALFLDRGQCKGPEIICGSEIRTDCSCRAFQTYRTYIVRGSALTVRNSGCNKQILPYASTSYPATAFLTVKRLES